ncbi:hypothetical protein IFM51744_10546 [Aspergillus udagawae]|nr:hypothetical protein IFM51744_10546 [Aspergillus udagawae]
MKIHYLLAIAAMAALSYHTQKQQSNCRRYLVSAGGLWVVLSVGSGVHAIIKKRWVYAWRNVTLRPFHELLRVEITVPAHWTVRPVQWVYLWLPPRGIWFVTSAAAILLGQHAQTSHALYSGPPAIDAALPMAL